MKKNISNKIKYLYLILTIGMVMYHARWVDKDSIIFLNILDRKALSFYLRFAEHIGFVCMVFFFFMSAFWFYNGLETKEELLKKLKKRFKTLLIPFIIWSLILLFYKTTYDGLVFKYKDTFYLFFESPVAGPLWYILGILILQLFSPLILKLKKYKKLVFSLFVFITIYIFLRNNSIFPKLLSFPKWWWYGNLLYYTPVYLVGAYLGMYHSDSILDKEYISKKYTIIGIILLLFSFVLWHFFSEIKYNLFALYSLIELLGVWFVLKPSLCKKDIPKLLNCNFYIFALHNPILIPKTQQVINNYLYSHSIFGLEMIAIKILQLCLIVIISMLIKFVASRVLSEKANYYLTGGR